MKPKKIHDLDIGHTLKEILLCESTTKLTIEFLNLDKEKLSNERNKMGILLRDIKAIHGWPLSIFVLELLSQHLPYKNLDIDNYVNKNFLPLRYSQNKTPDLIGLNAFQIYFDPIAMKFIWNKKFEEFIENNELKICSWINPLSNLILAIKFKKHHSCYFDRDHFIDAVRTILNLPSDILKRLGISPWIDGVEVDFLKDEDNEINKYFQKTQDPSPYSNEEYLSNKKIYPYIHTFLKKLSRLDNSAETFDVIAPQLISLFSKQTKQKYLKEFKTISSLYAAILFLSFQHKTFPTHFVRTFTKLIKINTNILPNVLNNFSYEDLKFILVGSNIAKLGHDNRSKNFLSCKRSLKELRDYGENNSKIGKELKNYFCFLDKHKILFENIKFYEDYSIEQIKSVQDLYSIGKEFRNCLRDNSYNYKNCFLNDHDRYFFILRNINNKEEKFILDANISENLLTSINALLGPDNNPVTNIQRDLTVSILQNEGIIEIDLRSIMLFNAKIQHQIFNSNNPIDVGIQKIKEKAEIIFAISTFFKKANIEHGINFYDNHFYDAKEQLTKRDESRVMQLLENIIVQSQSEQLSLEI